MAKSVSHPISTLDQYQLGLTALGLILESRVDMGCDRDFAMYYSLYKRKTSPEINCSANALTLLDTRLTTLSCINAIDNIVKAPVNFLLIFCVSIGNRK